MRRQWIVLIGLALLIVGCKSKESQLVGTWKARPVKAKSSNNLSDVMQSSQLSLWTQGMTIEFNRDGQFKVSQIMGAGTGSYKFEGDDIVLTLNSLAPQQPLHMRFGSGGTLELANDFKSDAQVVFEKTSS